MIIKAPKIDRRSFMVGLNPHNAQRGAQSAGDKPPALVRLKVRNARGVKVPFRENAFRPVTDCNCDTVRCGGEQREVKS